MASSGDLEQGGSNAVGRTFMVLYALAQVGAFIAFLPMLTILLPLKAEAIDPGGKAVLLSQVALWGAVAAGAANLVAGSLSDATRGRLGHRRPWIIAGAIATVGAYALVFSAAGPISLLLAVLAFQVAVNAMFGPLNAVLPDLVPDRQKGLVSALLGLALPGASLFGAAVIALWLSALADRFLVLGLAVLVLIVPFALTLREPRAAGPAHRPSLSLAALADHDFRMAFLSRMFVQVTMTLNVLYLFFYLQEAASDRAGQGPQTLLGWLLIAGTAAALIGGLSGGILSDRLARRRVFVMAGGLAMAVGAALMAVAQQWPGPLLAQVIFGLGLGLYSTVDIALVAEVLPEPDRAGRDLGLMNLAVTLPQIFAPLLGLAVLMLPGARMSWIFAASTVFALIGAASIGGIRRVR